MMKTILIATFVSLLVACGGDAPSASEEEGTTTVATEAAAKPSRNKTSPKWEVAIEGLPEQSGRVITAATMGVNGRYSLGNSGFISSIGVDENNPSSFMMYTFNDENVRCAGSENATVTIDGARAIIAGQVECQTKDGGEKRMAAIEGWFELKK